MEMHPPHLQIAQTWLQLWKINPSYKSYGLLLIWSTGFHWGSEFDTWGLDASEIRPKNSPPLEAIVFYPKTWASICFWNFAGYQKIQGHALLNRMALGVLKHQNSNQYKQWVFGGCCPPKKTPPKQHPEIFPWNPNHLGVGAKRGKAKGAIADSAGGQAFVWPN